MVGGDWFDSILLPSGRLGVVIGDVQGHDVRAAGLMSQLRTAIHAYAAEGHGPDAVLVRASRFLTSLDEGRFATCIYLEADPATGILRIARAGHPHPVLRLPDGTCLLKHVRGGLPSVSTSGRSTTRSASSPCARTRSSCSAPTVSSSPAVTTCTPAGSVCAMR